MKLLTLSLLLLATPALSQQASAAQPPFRACPYSTISMSAQFNVGPIVHVLYDQNNQLLYVSFTNNRASVFSGVPLNVMKLFTQASTLGSNALPIYNQSVVPSFHALALNEVNNCPLRFESGQYIWTTPQGQQPVFQPCPAIYLWPQVRYDYSVPNFYDQADMVLYLAPLYARSTAYMPVPYSVVQQIQAAQNPNPIFASIPKTYHELMLSNPDNCPLRSQAGGYMWSD
jgi:hypothetical protein